VAEIVPLSQKQTSDSDAALLDALERTGIVRRGSSELSNSNWTGSLPGKGAGVLDALLAERREAR